MWQITIVAKYWHRNESTLQYIQIYIQYNLLWAHFCANKAKAAPYKSHFLVLFSTEGAKLFLQCQIFSHLSLIWPKSLEICFVWSSSYHSSPFFALWSPPRFVCPVLHYLSSSNFKFSLWLTCRGWYFQRGYRASVEHNSPSIPPSFHPSTAPILPFPTSHLTELR